MSESLNYKPEQQEGEPIFNYNFKNSTVSGTIEAHNPEEAIRKFQEREGRPYGSRDGDGFEAMAMGEAA